MKADDKKDTGKSESAKETQGGYTKQQLAFIEGKKVLHNYEEIMKTRPLTEEERHNVARVKSMLLKKIFRYGMKLANDTMHKYRIPLDAYKDVQAEIALAFSEKLKDCPPKSRRYDVYSDILQKNGYRHLTEKRKTVIKNLFKGYRTMTDPIRQELMNLGFTIRDKGKHYRLTYYGDSRYKTTVAKSASDHRGGKNDSAEISTNMF